MDFTIIIPVRYASSRLPGKLLKNIHGKSLIEHTYSNAICSSVKRVIITTDDDRINNVAKTFGAEVCLTSACHISGTSRITEVVETLSIADAESLLMCKAMNQC